MILRWFNRLGLENTASLLGKEEWTEGAARDHLVCLCQQTMDVGDGAIAQAMLQLLNRISLHQGKEPLLTV